MICFIIHHYPQFATCQCPMDPDLESIQEARRLVEKAAEAQKVLERFSQEQIDAVVAAMAEAARQHAEPLARLAVEETTYRVVADKVEKNLFSARDVFNAIKNLKTVGVIRKDAENGVDRKSTRLNSSHSQISYAVFCLKKKKIKNKYPRR